ncbi:MAG: hypothetical protein ABSD96_02045 [Candidatus Korobacteraceae bacterium]|jgi:hypothetical protein
MADPLYLSLWFPTFRAEEMMVRALGVLQQFPFAPVAPGIAYVAVQPISYAEPSILERRFTPPATPQEAMEVVQEFAHEDYAITLEAYWELWTPGGENSQWSRRENKVNFILHGTEFDEGIYTELGHVEIDFGLDFPFLFEEMDLSPADQQRVRENVARLIAFTHAVEKHCQLTGRVLWSESEENLAQKLVARLQKVQ